MALFFKKSEQDTIVFLIFPAIKYFWRLMISFLLIGVGFFLQFYSFMLFPGVFLVFAGNLLLLIKGYDNRLKMGSYTHDSKWEFISNEQVNKLLNLHKRIISWDRSAFDITNSLGVLIFIVMLIVVIILIANSSNYNKSYIILSVNIVFLFFPHWVTGVKKILTMPVLILKINLLLKMLSDAGDKIKDFKIQYQILLKGDKKKSNVLPQDIKIKVSSGNDEEGFLGLYGQITTNDISGTMYPYFYVVLVAKQNFQLKERTKNYNPPSGLIKEYTTQSEVDVLILRQFTTRTSGYHTKAKVVNQIFIEGLALLKNVNAV
ncbi:MAG: hypothetical protein PHT69_04845 [Bacteroidales bacterium]|nr:hypothetical protein [Bacteroidales bacterium]